MSQLNVQDFKIGRPSSLRLFIGQSIWPADQWKEKHGLWFHADVEAASRWLERNLVLAAQATADLVLLPELSVPEECLPIAQSWSTQSGSIVIAGSHYFNNRGRYIARCPIIVAGQVFFTEKARPAPIELSPVEGEGLTPGNQICLFLNSTAGNFSVLICSDYLDHDIKRAVEQHKLDLLCVPAFQRNSEVYHSRMAIDCEESIDGLYIAYANSFCAEHGDGRSALFGSMDRIYLEKLQNSGFTDLDPAYKLCELSRDRTYMVAEIRLDQKKPFAKRTMATRPNIRIVQVGGVGETEAEKFGKAIGHPDQRYSKVSEFFVPPVEYDLLIERLEKGRLLFLVGDPGIGKTYTAVRLLRHYFSLGYDPIWYAGLEKHERLNQRQILENFRPREKQVIYFEDPFGRTVFERRESINRIFGPLVDHLQYADCRIIITSRKELFEQFVQETPTAIELKEFAEELNIVKPSYSAAALIEMLDKIAHNAKWYKKDVCRAKVIEQVGNGFLGTPLAIRDFVFSTEGLEDLDLLLDRLARRGMEERRLFAEEIESCQVKAKLTLSLVFLFGAQSLATLSQWFNQVAAFLDPQEQWSGTAPFFEALRHQMGHRVEQYGLKATILRFVHPFYEEAFAETAKHDAVTRDVLVSVAKYTARKELRICVNQLLRLRYRDLGLFLLKEIIPVVRTNASLSDYAQIGLRCLSFQSTFADKRYGEILKEMITLEELAHRIGDEEDPLEAGQGLRLYYNLGYRTKGGPGWPRAFASRIDWEKLFTRWVQEDNLSKVLSCLEWAHRFDRSLARAFFRSVQKTKFAAQVRLMNSREQERLYSIAPRQFSKEVLDSIDIQVHGRSFGKLSKIELGGLTTEGGVVIDAGAAMAIRGGFNLLPVGVTDVTGFFERGDIVSILSESGEYIGSGVASYSSDEVAVIKGKHSTLIVALLGDERGRAVIAKNRMLVSNS